MPYIFRGYQGEIELDEISFPSYIWQKLRKLNSYRGKERIVAGQFIVDASMRVDYRFITQRQWREKIAPFHGSTIALELQWFGEWRGFNRDRQVLYYDWFNGGSKKRNDCFYIISTKTKEEA